jgi:hypothetical protein
MAAHPRLGKLILAVSDEPGTSAPGARVLTVRKGSVAQLSELASERLVILHDRRSPRSRANIDHIAVSPTVVYVTDAKHYSGTTSRTAHAETSCSFSDDRSNNSESSNEVLGTAHDHLGAPTSTVPGRSGSSFVEGA